MVRSIVTIEHEEMLVSNQTKINELRQQNKNLQSEIQQKKIPDDQELESKVQNPQSSCRVIIP